MRVLFLKSQSVNRDTHTTDICIRKDTHNTMSQSVMCFFSYTYLYFIGLFSYEYLFYMCFTLHHTSFPICTCLFYAFLFVHICLLYRPLFVRISVLYVPYTLLYVFSRMHMSLLLSSCTTSLFVYICLFFRSLFIS